MPNLIPLGLFVHQNLLFAKEGGDIGAGFALIAFMILGGILLVLLAIQAVICSFLSRPLKLIPESHRFLSPGDVWILMFLLFNPISNFFVILKISNSLKAFAEAQGNSTRKDYGKPVGLIACSFLVVAFLFLILPILFSASSSFLNYAILFVLASLTFLIIYIVQVNLIVGSLQIATKHHHD
ncbi:MAG: hypothetical protein PVH19_09385 [Planctomycetia bacterium]|jgi:hypothetical protein